MKCVASMTNAGRGGGELVLEIDMGNAPKGGVWFEMEFESVMEMRSIEEGVKRVMMVFFEDPSWRQWALRGTSIDRIGGGITEG